jgi:hypothetical protein
MYSAWRGHVQGGVHEVGLPDVIMSSMGVRSLSMHTWACTAWTCLSWACKYVTLLFDAQLRKKAVFSIIFHHIIRTDCKVDART